MFVHHISSSKSFFIILFVLAIFFVGLSPDSANAQRRKSQSGKFKIGDFVKWKDRNQRNTYFVGRVKRADSSFLTVEGYFEDEGYWKGRLKSEFLSLSRTKVKIIWKAGKPVLFEKDIERTWRSKTGKSSIRAKLIRYEDKVVHLEKKDGKIVKVPSEKLSSMDNKFLESVEKQKNGETVFRAGVPKEVVQFFMVDVNKKKAAAAKEVKKKAEEKLALKSDSPLENLQVVSPASVMKLNVKQEEWLTNSFALDLKKKQRQKQFAVYSKNYELDDPKFSADSRSIVFLAKFTSKDFSDRDIHGVRNRIAVLDRVKEEVVYSEAAVRKDEKPICVSPSGQTVVTVVEGKKRKKYLSVWKLQNGVFKRKINAFLKFPNDHWTFGAYLLNDQLMWYKGSGGPVYILGIDQEKIAFEWAADISVPTTATHPPFWVEADKKRAYFYDAKQNTLLEFDLEKRKILGGLKLPGEFKSKDYVPQFSSDGESLFVRCRDQRIRQFGFKPHDMKSGAALVWESDANENWPTYRFRFFNSRIGMEFNGTLWSLKQNVEAGSWVQKEKIFHGRILPNGQRLELDTISMRNLPGGVEVVGDQYKNGDGTWQGQMVRVTQIPLMAIDRKLAEIKEEDVIDFKPGESFHITMDINDSDDIKIKDTKQQILGSLMDLGFDHREDADFQLRYTHKTLPRTKKTFEYYDFNRLGATVRTISFKPQHYHVDFFFKGEWFYGRKLIQDFSKVQSTKDVELMEAEIDKIDAGRFLRLKLPKRIRILRKEKRVSVRN